MENNNLEQYNNLLENDYFQISYEGQNYKELPGFQEWKRLMIEKYGDERKEIKCWNDNTIFYSNNRGNQTITCPTCRKKMYRCIFCNEVNKYDFILCCFRGCFHHIISEKIYKNPIENKTMLYLFIFPFISMVISIYAIINAFFCERIKYEKIIIFEKNILLVFIIICFTFLMSIIFGIIYHLLLIGFFILSIPFKLYPIKIYFLVLDFIK